MSVQHGKMRGQKNPSKNIVHRNKAMSFLGVMTYPPCGWSNKVKFLSNTNSKQEIFPVAA